MRKFYKNEIITLEQGATTPWEIASVISENFQLIVEQNFRKMKPDEMRALLHSLSDAELNDLAMLYNRSALNSGMNAVLLDTIAISADAAAIRRVGDHFGFEDTYAAVYRSAPANAYALTRALNPSTSRATTVSFANGGATGGMMIPNSGPTVGYTIGEVYLSFRTAPVGSLGVAGALYETASFVGTRLSVAYGAGYALGSAINSLWSTYSPSTYAVSSNLLGQAVDGFASSVSSLMNGTAFSALSMSVRSAIGDLQSNLFSSFLPGGPRATFYRGGGDFGVSSPWSYNERDSCK
ncbi:MAG: hypothetical protein QM788_05720 [Roseateles sp.]|uniref:hypothetical protein n=1 Tax=Roseateles sp. TaxID=1971397 RepID=UPI0039E77DE4